MAVAPRPLRGQSPQPRPTTARRARNVRPRSGLGQDRDRGDTGLSGPSDGAMGYDSPVWYVLRTRDDDPPGPQYELPGRLVILRCPPSEQPEQSSRFSARRVAEFKSWREAKAYVDLRQEGAVSTWTMRGRITRKTSTNENQSPLPPTT